MAEPFEKLSEQDQGIFFRQACDKAEADPMAWPDKVTVAHFFRIYCVEAPTEVVNAAMHVLDYRANSVPPEQPGPLRHTADYFTRKD
jgi:hypothetical protein